MIAQPRAIVKNQARKNAEKILPRSGRRRARRASRLKPPAARAAAAAFATERKVICVYFFLEFALGKTGYYPVVSAHFGPLRKWHSLG